MVTDGWKSENKERGIKTNEAGCAYDTGKKPKEKKRLS